jgi:alkanesulfonate monooxygenase SsuD/methylene tetrahydromethanopterin reductase-like flavin-dependent oxidoreductase (luciferase family)
MQFGWFTLSISPDPESDHAGIMAQLDEACAAEELGFDDVWLTEHNFSGESSYCDPIPFAAALAMRTSRIRIGFAVIQMALRQPVRLAVQLSLLDNLSRGRIDVGIGKGSLYKEYEYTGYGLRGADSRARMDEGLELLTRAWTEAPLDFRGTYFQARLPAIRPRPYQQPHPPIWRSVMAPASFGECGRLGAPILTGRVPLAKIPERLKLYQDGLEAGGHPEALRRQRLREAAVWRQVHVGESDAQAEDELSAAMLYARHHMHRMCAAHNPEDFTFDPAVLDPWTNPQVSDADGLRHLLDSAIYGSPARVAEQMAMLRHAGVHHVLCQMSFGDMSHARVMASMRRFATGVMPHFQGAAGADRHGTT